MTSKAAMPAPPNFAFEEDTLFETHRGFIRWVRKLLNPLLKLLFNPNPLIQALHIQSELNSRNAKREELDFLYEGRGPKVFPTFAVIPAFAPIQVLFEKTRCDMTRLLHGGQVIRLHRPIPAEGTLQTVGHIKGIYDMKKLAQVVLDASGRPLLVSNVDLSAARVAGLANDVVARFLHELAESAGLTLHVRLIEGEDTQHVLEAIFKALGVALGDACSSRR